MTPSRPLILGSGDTIIGAILLTGAATRTSSPAYAQIKQIANVHTWGAALLVIGVLLLVAALAHRHLPPHLAQRPQRACASLGAAWCAFWAVCLLQTANADQRVSYTGAALWFFFGTIPHLFLSFGKEG